MAGLNVVTLGMFGTFERSASSRSQKRSWSCWSAVAGRATKIHKALTGDWCFPRSFLFVAVITDLSWWYDMFTEQVLFLGAHVFAPSNCNMRTRPEYIITTRSTILQAHRWMFKLLIYIFSSIQLHDWKVWRQQARNIKKCLLLTWSEKSMAFLPSHISGSFSFAWKDSAWHRRGQKEAMTGCQSRWIVSLQTKNDKPT